MADIVATVDDVRCLDKLGELTSLSEKDIQCILDLEVVCFVGSTTVWGSCLRLAQSLVAAHIAFLSIQGADAASGPVVSESAGGLSRSYGQTSTSGSTSEYWGSTTWGRQYLQLRRARATTPMVLC